MQRAYCKKQKSQTQTAKQQPTKPKQQTTPKTPLKKPQTTKNPTAVMISVLGRFTSPLSAHQEYLVGLLSPLILELSQSLIIGARIRCHLDARFCFCQNL